MYTIVCIGRKSETVKYVDFLSRVTKHRNPMFAGKIDWTTVAHEQPHVPRNLLGRQLIGGVYAEKVAICRFVSPQQFVNLLRIHSVLKVSRHSLCRVYRDRIFKLQIRAQCKSTGNWYDGLMLPFRSGSLYSPMLHAEGEMWNAYNAYPLL